MTLFTDRASRYSGPVELGEGASHRAVWWCFEHGVHTRNPDAHDAYHAAHPAPGALVGVCWECADPLGSEPTVEAAEPGWRVHAVTCQQTAEGLVDMANTRSLDSAKTGRLNSRPEEVPPPSGPSPTPETDRSEHG